MNRKSRYYRGIGSGIVRILTENPSIELDNDVEGKEFKVIIWRTIQKDGVTTQKDLDTTQKSESTTQKEHPKDISTIQKSNSTTQKDLDTTPKSNSTTQKDLDTTQKRVLEYFKNNPKGTRVEAANALGNITEDGVKFVIGKLQQKGLLKRVGGRKHGEWQIISDADTQK